MRPDAMSSMRSALALGPGHCPPDLFAGPVDAIIRGLKAHANHISHSRHKLLDETYPRTRDLLGSEAFHRHAKRHLVGPAALRQPPARLGAGFADTLAGAARDLAAVEWAWLESHGAADAIAFDLEAIAGLPPERVAAASVSRHVAAHRIDISAAARFAWEGSAMPSSAILVTRPRLDVIVTAIDPATARLFDRIDRPHLIGDLLDHHSAATTTLVTAGALTVHMEML